MPDTPRATGRALDPHPCAYCAGAGEVSGMIDDVEFVFVRPCTGGNEDAVRWLLGRDKVAPPGEDWVI